MWWHLEYFCCRGGRGIGWYRGYVLVTSALTLLCDEVTQEGKWGHQPPWLLLKPLMQEEVSADVKEKRRKKKWKSKKERK